MKKQIKKNKKGFTLVEMIVVIAIIGVLAAMMVPSLLGYIDKANTSNNRAAATNIGRTAQAVLAGLNNPSIAGTYSANGNTGATTGITGTFTAASSGVDGGFDAEMEKMMQPDKFKGSFAITIVDGSVKKVSYQQSTGMTAVSTATSSTKLVGIYPEG